MSPKLLDEENSVDGRRKPVLILECNSALLVRQNLSVGRELRGWLQTFFPRNRLTLVEAQTRAQLLQDFAKLRERGDFYGDIVVIGHSSRRGLRINADDSIDWNAVRGWLEPFKPRHLYLLACEAGRWLPCAALFAGEDNPLKEIIGSPVPASKQEQYFILAAVLHRLDAKQIDPELVKMMQLANLFINKGVMFRRTKAEFKRDKQEQGAIWTGLGEPLLEQLIKFFRQGNQ